MKRDSSAYIGNGGFVGEKSSLYCQVSPIEKLRYVVCDGVIRYVSDVNLLMNSERIQQELGEEVYLNLIRSIKPRNSPYAQGKYTDEQLRTAIKSRYLQSPSEVLAWMDELISRGDEISEKVSALKQELQESQSPASVEQQPKQE